MGENSSKSSSSTSNTMDSTMAAAIAAATAAAAQSASAGPVTGHKRTDMNSSSNHPSKKRKLDHAGNLIFIFLHLK